MQKIRKIHRKKKFEEIYSGFVNGICIPTDEIQHARLHEPSGKEGTTSPINSDNEGKWIEVVVKNKVKKVQFMCQDRFGKTNSNVVKLRKTIRRCWKLSSQRKTIALQLRRKSSTGWINQALERNGFGMITFSC